MLVGRLLGWGFLIMHGMVTGEGVMSIGAVFVELAGGSLSLVNAEAVAEMEGRGLLTTAVTSGYAAGGCSESDKDSSEEEADAEYASTAGTWGAAAGV